ncbi:D-amino-acid transaminase [Brevibacillus nitrificans]|uniref:D-amino-acid transaminase n=1 Tax=Brevibacillus nitrificans TaxID=651560 RepID=UPI002E21C9BB|nr:D-amino-acid transaminase [Brevibacillus nitrificans]
MGQNLAFFNERFLDPNERVLPVEERGLQFGDGVYEMIRLYRGVPFTLQEHLARLEQSAHSIMLTLPKTLEEIAAIVQAGIAQTKIAEGTVYIQVTRGTAPRNHLFPEDVAANLFIVWKEGVPDLGKQQEVGVVVFTFPDERWHNCYIKSICLLPNVLAKEKAHQRGGHEAIFIRDNEVKEGTSTNLFIVKDGVFKTPIADQSILNGITRQKIIEILKKQDVPVLETRLTMEDIEVADEVIITSTTQEAVPVVQVNDRKVGAGKPGAYFQKLAAWFQKEVDQSCPSSSGK